MLKLYGQYRSRAARVAWLCKEPWYAALNPNKRVPTVDDDGVVMEDYLAKNAFFSGKE
jgi:glutathione S-transferase